MGSSPIRVLGLVRIADYTLTFFKSVERFNSVSKWQEFAQMNAIIGVTAAHACFFGPIE